MKHFIVSGWITLWVLVGGPVQAQFTPTVQTEFDNLDAGSTSGFVQSYEFFAGQEGPLSMTMTTDKGDLDTAGLLPGSTVGQLVVDVFYDLPEPFPDVEGQILGEVVLTEVAADSMAGEAVVIFTEPQVIGFLILAGFADPTGQVAFDLAYEDLGDDQGIQVTATDAGAFPLGGSSPLDLPIEWTTQPVLDHSTTGGLLTVSTDIEATGGAILQETETFPLVSNSPLFVRGDFDSSGALGLADAIQLLQFLFQSGAEPGCFSAADVDDNGALGLGDPIGLLNYLFADGVEPPDPGPTSCGPDPTVDTLACSSSGCP